MNQYSAHVYKITGYLISMLCGCSVQHMIYVLVSIYTYIYVKSSGMWCSLFMLFGELEFCAPN